MGEHDDHARFDAMAADWDERPRARERAAMIADAIRGAITLSPTAKVLEIGGGTGLLARALADDIGTAVVTDVSTGMVSSATTALDDPRYEGWRAERFDVERDPLPGERFDLVISQLALHHMGDIPAVIRRLVELLGDGGRVALVDLERDADGGFHRHVHDFRGHHGFDREQLATWLREAGFVDVEVRDAGHDVKEVDGQERSFPLILVTGRRG